MPETLALDELDPALSRRNFFRALTRIVMAIPSIATRLAAPKVRSRVGHPRAPRSYFPLRVGPVAPWAAIGKEKQGRWG